MVLKILRQFAFFLSVISLHAQESAFERLSLNKLNSTFNHGDHVQVEHGTGKVLFNYDFKCELSSRGMVFRPRIMVQPSAKTSANFNGCAYIETQLVTKRTAYQGSIANVVLVNIPRGGFLYGENNLFVRPDGGIFTTAPNFFPSEAIGFNFNADPSSVGSIEPGWGNFYQDVRAIVLPDGRSVSIPTWNNPTGQAFRINIQDHAPLLQQFGYPLSQFSRGGPDNTPPGAGETGYKLESGGMAFFLKDDNGKEGFYGPYANYAAGQWVDGVVREAWMPALVLVVQGNEAYEYELIGVIASHYEDAGTPDENPIEYKVIDGCGYRLRKMKNKFGDYIQFDYDAEDVGYTAKLYIDGGYSGESLELVPEGKTNAMNPPLFGYLSTILLPQTDEVLNLKLRSTMNGIPNKTYSLTAAIKNDKIFTVTEPIRNKRRTMQFLSIVDPSDGLRCDISYVQLFGTLPYGPGLTVGAVGIDSIEFNNGLKYQFVYKPDLYFADFGDWNSQILAIDIATWFPGITWGVSEVRKIDTLIGETRTTHYDRRIPEPQARTYPIQWNSLDFWERETFPDGSGVKRVFTSPVPGYFGNAPIPYPTNPYPGDPYAIRLQLYLFKKGALQREEFFDKNGTVYKTVNYDAWENRNLANPNADPALGMDAHPTRTVTTLIAEGVTSTQAHTAWDAVNIGWTRLDHTISGPGGSFNRGISWTLQSNPPYGLFGLRKQEIRPGYPTLTRTFDSMGLLTSEQADGGTLQLKKDFQIVQGRVKGFTLTGTGLGGLPSTSSLAYDYDALGYLNKIQAGNGLLTYLRNYDSEGRPTQDTDPNGFAVSYQWDGANRLKGITPGGEFGSQVDYPTDLRSLNLTRGQYSEGRRFNAFGELVSVQLPGGTKTFRYDSLGRKTFESVIAGSQGTTYSYDSRGRLNALTDPNGLITSYGYSGLTKTVTVGTDTTAFTSDALGRLITVVDAKGQNTGYSYDEGDRVTSVKQYGLAGIQSRSWAYNTLGWLTSLTQPESGTTTYSDFAVTGKPQTTDYNGRKVRITYDALSRATAIRSDDGSLNQSFAFDGGSPFNGKLRTSTDQGVRLDYGYGGLNGRLDSLTTTLSDPISGAPVLSFSQSFAYDGYGNRVTATLPSGRTVNYIYDLVRGVLKEVDAASGLPNSFGAAVAMASVPAFNPADSPLSLLLAQGVSTTFTYSNDQTRLTTMEHLKASSSLRKWFYNWNFANGRLDGDGEDSYQYDPLGRLVQANLKPLAGTLPITQAFSYDAFGNQKSSLTTNLPSELDRNFANFTFNDAQFLATNRLPSSTASGAQTGASYDPQGNLIQIYKQVGATNRAITLAYDALGRVLAMADLERGITEKYFYTPEGLRTRIEVYQGIPPAPLVFQKARINIYNDQRQLVTELEAN